MDRAQEGRRFFLGRLTPGNWLAPAVLGCMTLTLLALFVFPVRRIFADVEVTYNEGWNAYKQAMAAHAIPLYGAPRAQFTGSTGYPPLSFHLIGWLGRMGSFTAAGRWVSLISLIVAGVFVALIVRRESGSPWASLFSFLLYEIGVVILLPNRVGMNDPQLLGEALSACGLYFYLRSSGSNRLLYISAFAFCLAGFTKQNLIAFPVAVGLDLLLRSRKEFATWAAALLVSVGLMLTLTFLIDGRYFFVDLTAPRAYSVREAWTHLHKYLSTFQVPLVIAGVWSVLALRSRTALACAFFLSHFAGFFFVGGDGVDFNVFFNALMATVILCGIALTEVTFASARSRPTLLNLSAGPVLMLAVFGSVLINIPGLLLNDFGDARNLRHREVEFRSAVQFVKTRSGPALCENLLLCYQAVKPLEYDAFFVLDQLQIGRLQEDQVTKLLRTHYFQTVQVNVPEEQANRPAELVEPRRFTRTFMRELGERYAVGMRTSQLIVFVPK